MPTAGQATTDAVHRPTGHNCQHMKITNNNNDDDAGRHSIRDATTSHSKN